MKNAIKFNYIKNFSIGAIILVGLFAVSLLCLNPAQAAHGLSNDFHQVKTADNSTVYYLDHNRGLKKAYISSEVYLSYGNKWEDIKIISNEELSRFSDIHLVKTVDSPAVFYIQNGKKATIHNEEEFLSHGFSWDDIITVSAMDLAGYEEANLDDIYVSGSIQVARAESDYTDKIKVPSEKLTVSKSNIYIYGAHDEEDRNFTKGQEGVRIGKFYIEASAGDDAIINSLSFAKGDTPGSITYDKGFSSIKLYIGSKKIGETIKKPHSETYEFNDFSYRVEAGEREVVSVYADISQDLKVNEVQLILNNIIAKSHISGIDTSIHGLNVKGYYVGFGEAKAELGVVAGGEIYPDQDDNLAGSFKIKNIGNEELELRYITLVTSGKGFSKSLGYTNLAIRENESNKKIGRKSSPVSGANRIRLNYDIPAGESKLFNVYVDTNDDVSSENFKIYFTDLEARGEESKIDADIAGDPSDGLEINVQGSARISNQQSSITTSEPTNIGEETGIDLTNTSVINTVVEEDGFIRPVNGGYISYGFGADQNDGYMYGVHNGIDIVISQKTKVYASASGVVSYMADGGRTDRASYIEIDHNNGFKTRYGHLYEMYVNIGDKIEQGQLIGLSGGVPNTYGAGATTNGAHLHFDMTYDDRFVDPKKYL